MADDLDLEQVVSELVTTLQNKFPDRSAAEIERVVRVQVDELKDRPVQDYISVLAQRAAKKALRTS